jgi:hypothetical protein
MKWRLAPSCGTETLLDDEAGTPSLLELSCTSTKQAYLRTLECLATPSLLLPQAALGLKSLFTSGSVDASTLDATTPTASAPSARSRQ